MYDWFFYLLAKKIIDRASDPIFDKGEKYIKRAIRYIKAINGDDKDDAQLFEENAKEGIKYLLDGMNSDVEKVRKDAFSNAYRKFTNLTALAPKEQTKSCDKKIDNECLIALGYWGRFHYFNLQGDVLSAVKQIYECTKEYPLHGVAIFSSISNKFFSEDYHPNINKLQVQLNTLNQELRTVINENIGHYIIKAGSIVVMGGVAVSSCLFLTQFLVILFFLLRCWE